MDGRSCGRWLGLLLLCCAGTAHAQTGRIAGSVQSETGAPLIGAVVQAVAPAGGTAAGTLTNQAGRYVMTGLEPGTYTVVVTTTGYATGRAPAVVAADAAVVVDFTLAAQPIDLDPVVVSASRHQERALEAPARVEVVGPRSIEERPAVQPTEHLRGVSGVDIVSQGLQSTNVVARGFNNVFSGALLALTDHRIAAIPSLRVNALYMVPATNEDIERMEVVLGPGSALYGPNTANGVLHMFTRSPLVYQGTTASVTGGERDVLQTTFRTAHLLSEDVGVKVSAQYFRGDEWQFEDPVEVSARQAAVALDPNTRVGLRDFDTRRWALDGRADWRINPDATLIVSLGRSTTDSGIELTGAGAAQVDDWTYDYYQTRFSWGRLFAQAYLNRSDAGETYLLRTGESVVDESQLFVAQVQHGFEPVNWQNFTYGIDYIRTMPETGGTIHGEFEDDDTFTETGAFLQSETSLGRYFELVLAGRLDRHSVIEETVFSPRAALVFKPMQDQTLRLTYNRAYSNPGSINLFLDLNAGPVPGPAGQLGYLIRVRGTGREGIQFQQADGSFAMRSPFAGDPTMLQTVNTLNLWQMQVRGLAAVAAAQGQPLSPQLVQYLLSLQPTEQQIGVFGLDPVTRQAGAFTAPEDVPGIRESNVTTYEVGYKGILGGRLLLAADLWYAERDNFISPLVPQNPFVLLNPQELGAYAVPRITQFLMAAGMPQQQAQATAVAIATNMAQIPGGVVSSADVPGGPALIATYRNFGDINLWGSDLSAQALFGDWTVGLSGSFVNEDHFETDGQIVTLNAPKRKLMASVGYHEEQRGFNGELRVRHLGGFPVNSGVYVGLECVLPEAVTDPCVESSTLLDVTLGYTVRQLRGASVQLTVQNLLDEEYRSFVGVPEIGRMALLRLKYDF